LIPVKHAFLLAALFIFILAVSPAQAFTAKNLDISVQADTNATITFDYDLTVFERAAVFMRIADPALELKKALESNYHKPVTVTHADGSRLQVVVRGFASKSGQGGAVTMRTPALSFVSAQKVLDQYWFAPIIHPDFSPSVTRVTFPDGYTREFSEQIAIPAISHTLNA